MKKHPVFTIVIIIALTICCLVVVYLNSNFRYSKLLFDAITSEDELREVEIVEKKPSCVNTYPTLAPYWWQSLMDQPIIGYPLVEACRTGNIEIIEILVDNGADINLGAKFTPLSYTYYQKPKNWYVISLYLIENGASLDYISYHSAGNVLTDIVGSRPGSIIDQDGVENSIEVAEAFYYALENCDHSKINWMRVLQHSVTYDRIEIVKFLLDKGYCDVNDTSVGMTALMFAARDSTPEMVELLLSYGADTTYTSSDGMTAYDYAVEYNDESVVSLLAYQ